METNRPTVGERRLLPYYGLWALIAVMMSLATHYIICVSNDYNKPFWQGGLRYVVVGWIPDRRIDLSDPQYFSWRSSIFSVVLLFGTFVVASRWIRSKCSSSLRVMRLWYTASGFVVLFVLHGVNGFLWVSMFCLLGFAVSRIFSCSRMTIWIANVAILAVVHYWTLPTLSDCIPLVDYIPHQKGLMNWQTYYKMVVLKLISFGIEYCSFFQDQANEIHLQYKKLDDRDAENSLTQARGRQGATVSSFPLRLGDFSFTNLISYALYPPLYLAGPITTFDRFVHNMQHPQTEVSTKEIVKSVIKVALYMLLMEIGLHYIYAHSFSAYGEWSRLSPVALSLVCYYTLNFMFMKFLIIWRTFRSLALFDGIYAPENMRKCISNSLTFRGFWRTWHGSYSDWILKYMYVPMGGKNTRIWGVWVIFTFVALWHEFNTKWVAFGVFNAAGLALETIVLQWVSKQTIVDTNSSVMKAVGVLAGGVNLCLLILANFSINHGFSSMGKFMRLTFFETQEANWNILVSVLFISLGSLLQYLSPWRREIELGRRSLAHDQHRA